MSSVAGRTLMECVELRRAVHRLRGQRVTAERIGYLLGISARHVQRLLGDPAPPAPDGDDAWKRHGSCRDADPELFFPTAESRTTAQAKRVCGGCGVRERCLQWALDRDERYGVWGGVSERERRQLRKQQRERESA